MIQMLRKRLDRKDEGFTLIELMVVVLIIAILLAIAIPTFLGARSRAQNRSAESNLRNALTAEKTGYTDAQTYDAASVVQSVEPSLIFSATAPTTWAANDIQVTPSTNSNGVCLVDKSASGNYYGIFDVATVDSSGGFQSVGTFYSTPSTSAAPTCPTASSGGAITTPTSGWATSTTAADW